MSLPEHVLALFDLLPPGRYTRAGASPISSTRSSSATASADAGDRRVAAARPRPSRWVYALRPTTRRCGMPRSTGGTWQGLPGVGRRGSSCERGPEWNAWWRRGRVAAAVGAPRRRAAFGGRARAARCATSRSWTRTASLHARAGRGVQARARRIAAARRGVEASRPARTQRTRGREAPRPCPVVRCGLASAGGHLADLVARPGAVGALTEVGLALRQSASSRSADPCTWGRSPWRAPSINSSSSSRRPYEQGRTDFR